MDIGVGGALLTKKKYQRIDGTTISILYKIIGKNCGNSSCLWSYSHFSTIL